VRPLFAFSPGNEQLGDLSPIVESTVYAQGVFGDSLRRFLIR